MYDENKYKRLVSSFKNKFDHILTEDEISLVKFTLSLNPVYKRENLHLFLYNMMIHCLRTGNETLQWCMDSVKEFLNKTSLEKSNVSIENFILRYGNSVGVEKYYDKNKKSSKTLENYIIRLGKVDGEAEYKNYISKLGKPKKILDKPIFLQGKELAIQNYQLKHDIKFNEDELNFIRECFNQNYNDAVKEFVYNVVIIAHRQGKESLQWCMESFKLYFESDISFKATPSLEVYILRYGNTIGERDYLKYKANHYGKNILKNTV